jgi:hypothetical protein
MVRTLGREYDQQITERHSLDRAERGPGEASGLLPSEQSEKVYPASVVCLFGA